MLTKMFELDQDATLADLNREVDAWLEAHPDVELKTDEIKVFGHDEGAWLAYDDGRPYPQIEYRLPPPPTAREIDAYDRGISNPHILDLPDDPEVPC